MLVEKMKKGWVLRAPDGGAGDGGAGGDGGGSGGGEGGDPPKTLTDEQEQQVGRIVNAAITSQLKRFDVEGKIKEAIEGLDLESKIKSALEGVVPKPGEGGPDKDKKKDVPPEIQAQLQKLADDLETEKAARKSAEEQRVKAEQDARFNEARSVLRNLLAPKVRPELLDVLVDKLAKLDGRLKVDEDGNATLAVKKAPFKGAAEEDVDLPIDDGVKSLLGSKEIHPFLPAPGGQQGGGGPGKGPGNRVPSSGGGGGDDLDAAFQKRLEEVGIDADPFAGG